MSENTNIVTVIHNLIKDELEKYSDVLEDELSEKYKKEFENRLREHRRKLILDVVENIKIGHHYEPSDMSSNITIKL